MLIGFAADIHLDRHLGGRTDAAGVNLRALDLERSLGRVVDALIEERVDVACFLGDLFHVPKPSERARQTLLRELRRLAAGLPDAAIVLLRGNHDAPSGFLAGTAVGTTALALPGVHVADAFETRRVEIGDVTLTLIPWMRSDEELIAALAAAAPVPGRHNLLLLHAGLADLAEFAEMRPGSQTVTRALLPAGYDWIFSGHFHGHRVLPDLRWTFVGSPERLSVSEAGQAKGIVLWDTATAAQRFRPLATRSWYDLGTVDGRGMDAAAVHERLERDLWALPDLPEAIVRLRLVDLAPEVHAALDGARINRLRARAFWADIELRARIPEIAAGAAAAPDGPDGALLSDLETEWERWVAGLPDHPDELRARMREMGLAALRAAAG